MADTNHNIETILNSWRFLRSATIQDLNMLDTDYALLVAEQEKLAANFKKSLIKDSLQLLAAVTAVYILTQGVIFSWHWRGIWSIYTTPINHQTVLVCRYCSIDYNSIILVKTPNITLKQVIGQPTYPKRLIRLAVKDYPNNPQNSNSWELISGETLQGRVLFLPSSISIFKKVI